MVATRVEKASSVAAVVENSVDADLSPLAVAIDRDDNALMLPAPRSRQQEQKKLAVRGRNAGVQHCAATLGFLACLSTAGTVTA